LVKEKMKITQCKSTQETQARAGELLRALLMDAKEHTQSVLLLLSGGSAFSLLDAIPKDALGEQVTIGVLDERFSQDEADNNSFQLTGTKFYANAYAVGVSFIDTRAGAAETQALLADRFEKALHEWAEAHVDGVIIATMGVGADGHTAGIMPFPENPVLFQKLFEDKTKWVAAYDAGTKNPYPFRVTVTMPFLRTQVDHAVVYAVGEEKKSALEKVLLVEGSLAETPARIFHEMSDVRMYFVSI